MISPAEASSAAGGREEPAMWQDLAALTPPLVVCVAFLIGLAMFLRREMSQKRRAERAAKRRSPGPRS
jgi:membrane protein insertase Oxa1/YidC/SpoIIIJ